jgi:hypothetical protein
VNKFVNFGADRHFWWARLPAFRALVVVAVTVTVGGRASEPVPAPPPVTFVFTSDVHFGINRGNFRGGVNVEAKVVNAAMVEAINALPTASLPDDGGVRAGRPVGAVDFVTITGDLTNRQERLPLKIQSASTSWRQFEQVFYDGLKLMDASGRPAPLLLVPGNHDVSNAIGHPNGLQPATDATTMVELYNRFVRPATPRTKSTYRYATDKIYYSRDFGGARCIFLTMWPDSGARKWMDDDLRNVPATTPVLLFAHNPAKVDARHFTNPHGKGDINNRDKFENVIGDVYAGGKTADGSTEVEQRLLAAWLKTHRNIVGYFHGHANWTDFYNWKGPDKNVSLHSFRSDSPMKGRESGPDETKLSFQVIVFDVAAKKLTARECRWNTAGAKSGKTPVIRWGESNTVSLAPR